MKEVKKRLCTKCGKPLSMHNNTNECFHHKNHPKLDKAKEYQKSIYKGYSRRGLFN